MFWDDDGAGYFTSPAGDTSILIRLKEGELCYVTLCLVHVWIEGYLDDLDIDGRIQIRISLMRVFNEVPMSWRRLIVQ